MYKHPLFSLEILKWQKLMKEFSKFNYLSYDTLFVKSGLILFSEKIHKVWQFSVSRKYHENYEKY